jgi:GMP synthase-like glutamine amidotransferase
MSKEVLIFLHMDDKHPGYIANYLETNNIPYRVVRGYAGDSIPLLNDSMAGLVFMGGAMSANDAIPWIEQEIELIYQAIDANVPVLGHCLGGQLISVALGADVTAHPTGEVGWHSCNRQPNAEADKWLGTIDEPFPMFHWHFETFSLPQRARLLFSSEYCQNQAYSVGENVLAMQCHVEMTEPLITHWITQWQDDLQEMTATKQNYQQIRASLKDNVVRLNQVAEQLYSCWAKSLQLKLKR